MPVGAGSIKRAAKAAGTAKKQKAAELLETAENPIEETEGGTAGAGETLETEAVVASAEGGLEETAKDMPQTVPDRRKSKSKVSGEKSGKKPEKKSKKEAIGKRETESEVSEQKKETVKKTEKKSGAGRTKIKNASEEKRSETNQVQSAEKPAERYEAYGIGQPLPVHLL